MKIRVALLQLLPGDALQYQYETGQAACRKAKEMGADIVLVHGNAYRRPQKYSLLVSDEKKEPFIRKDYRP